MLHVFRIRLKITWPHEAMRKKTFSYDRRIEKNPLTTIKCCLGCVSICFDDKFLREDNILLHQASAFPCLTFESAQSIIQ